MSQNMLNFLKASLLMFVISMMLIEIALRVSPKIIPPHLLIHFHPVPRKEAAMGRFQLKEDTVLLQRDDNGPPLRLVKPNKTLQWKNMDGNGRKHSVVTDEVGFCNKRGVYQASSSFDIVTIGDSFTWCLAVDQEQTWTSNLANHTALSAYNLGKTGVGLYEYIQILKSYGLKKDPRYVVLSVYGGNDLRDAYKYDVYKHNTNVETPKENKLLLNTVEYLAEKSYVVSLIQSLFLVDFIVPPNKISRSEVDFRYKLLFKDSELSFNGENTDKDEVIFAKKLLNDEISLDLFNDALKEFVNLSEQHDFIPIIVYIPSAHVAYKKHVVFNDQEIKNIMFEFDSLQRKYFAQMANEVGYVYNDLSSTLQDRAEKLGVDDLLYYRRNLHLSVLGHKEVAKAVSTTIEKHSFVNSND